MPYLSVLVNMVHTSSLTAAWLFLKMTPVFELQLHLFYSLLCVFIKVTLCFSSWRYIFFHPEEEPSRSILTLPAYQWDLHQAPNQYGSFQIYLNSSLMLPLDLWCSAVPYETRPVWCGGSDKGTVWIISVFIISWVDASLHTLRDPLSVRHLQILLKKHVWSLWRHQETSPIPSDRRVMSLQGWREVGQGFVD